MQLGYICTSAVNGRCWWIMTSKSHSVKFYSNAEPLIKRVVSTPRFLEPAVDAHCVQTMLALARRSEFESTVEERLPDRKSVV